MNDNDDDDDDIDGPHQSTNSSPSSSDENNKKISTSSYYKFSTLLAIFITFPGIVVLFILRYYDIDILYQIMFSSIAFFICIGFSFKISSKLTKFYKN